MERKRLRNDCSSYDSNDQNDGDSAKLKRQVEILKQQRKTFKEYVDNTGKKLKSLEDEVGSLKAEKRSKSDLVSQLEDQVAILEEQRKSFAECEDNMKSLEDEVRVLKAEKCMRDNLVSQLEEQVEALQERRNTSTDREKNLKSLDAEVEDLTAEKSGKDNSIVQLKQQVEILKGQRKSFKTYVDNTGKKVESLEDEVGALKAEKCMRENLVARLENQLEVIKREMTDNAQTSLEEIEKFVSEKQELQEELKVLRRRKDEEIKSLKIEIEALREKGKDSKKEEIAAWREKCKAAEESRNLLVKEVDNLKKANEVSRNRCEVIQSSRDSMVDALQKEVELLTTECELSLESNHSSDKKVCELRSKLRLAENDLGLMEEKVKEMRREAKESKNESDRREKRIEALSEELAFRDEENSTLMEDLNNTKANLSASINEISVWRRQFEKEKKSSLEIRAENESLRNDLEGKTIVGNQNSILRAKVSELEAELTKKAGSTVKMTDDLNSSDKEKSSLMDKLLKAQNDLEESEKQLEKEKKSSLEIQAENESLRHDLEGKSIIGNQNTVLMAKVSELEAELIKKDGLIVKMTDDLKSSDKEKSSLTDQLLKTQSDLEESGKRSGDSQNSKLESKLNKAKKECLKWRRKFDDISAHLTTIEKDNDEMSRKLFILKAENDKKDKEINRHRNNFVSPTELKVLREEVDKAYAEKTSLIQQIEEMRTVEMDPLDVTLKDTVNMLTSEKFALEKMYDLEKEECEHMRTLHSRALDEKAGLERDLEAMRSDAEKEASTKVELEKTIAELRNKEETHDPERCNDETRLLLTRTREGLEESQNEVLKLEDEIARLTKRMLEKRKCPANEAEIEDRLQRLHSLLERSRRRETDLKERLREFEDRQSKSERTEARLVMDKSHLKKRIAALIEEKKILISSAKSNSECDSVHSTT